MTLRLSPNQSEELPDDASSVQMQPTVFPQDGPTHPPPQRQVTTCLPTGSLPPVLNRTIPTAAPEKGTVNSKMGGHSVLGTTWCDILMSASEQWEPCWFRPETLWR